MLCTNLHGTHRSNPTCCCCFPALQVLKLLHCDQVGLDGKKSDQGEFASAVPVLLCFMPMGCHRADVACSPACISHAVFGSQVCDIKVCQCGANSDPGTLTPHARSVLLIYPF